jgi:arylsulfatase A-like enzyme
MDPSVSNAGARWSRAAGLGVSLLLGAALFACGSGGASDKPSEPSSGELPPNILLISIDSLRADHLGCYGYERPTSPAIDALGQEGVIFGEAISQAPWTLPSHASLLTSLYGRTHQTNDISRQLPSQVPTIASELSKAGYETAAVVSGTFMKKQFGLNSGFDHYDDDIAEMSHKESHEAVTSPGIHQKAEEFLADVQEPFMLFLHYWDVHYDYDPPPPYDTKFDPDYEGSITSKSFLKNRRIQPGMAEADLDHVVSLYDGEIGWVDEHIAKLLANLEASGLDERTIVILTADHGDEFFEHGGKGHSHSLYHELVHVPLIIRGPGITPGGRISAPVELIDIMPTILDLTGLDAPEGLQGRSLKHALGGAELPSQPVFSETTRARIKKPDPWAESWSVQNGQLKLIQHGEGPNGEPARPDERYDLAADPREQSSLGGEANPLEEAMERWMARVPLGLGTENNGVDKATMEQLKAHGYAGDDD